MALSGQRVHGRRLSAARPRLSVGAAEFEPATPSAPKAGLDPDLAQVPADGPIAGLAVVRAPAEMSIGDSAC